MSMDVLIGRVVYLCQFKGIQMVYTYRRGLLRCSFNSDGQCEGLLAWDG